MTTTNSYWTDVICDIILNGKEKEETVSKIRMEHDPKGPPHWGCWSQVEAILSLPKPRQHSTLGKTCLGLCYELHICSYMNEILSLLLILEL